MPATWIEHKGKKILFMDQTKSITTEEQIGTLMEAQRLMAEHSQTSKEKILMLSGYGPGTSDEYRKVLADLGKKNSDLLGKNATFGITGLKKIFLTAYTALTGQNVVMFDSMERAKDYLVE